MLRVFVHTPPPVVALPVVTTLVMEPSSATMFRTRKKNHCVCPPVLMSGSSVSCGKDSKSRAGSEGG